MNNDLAKREETRAESVETKRWLEPPVDVFENEDEWLVSADVPGVDDEGLRVHLQKSEILIEARRDGGEAQGFAYAGYRRTFTLPTGVDAEKVTAEMTHGVVSVHLPKAASIKPRQIHVRAG